MSARLTPYELAFPLAEFEARIFPEVRAELEGRAIDDLDPDAFLSLETVGRTLRELDLADGEAGPMAPLEAREYTRLLFHAYRFWHAGRTLIDVADALARDIATSDHLAGDWTFEAPQPAGYVQLPRHRFWARTADDAPAEAVDGFFWAVTRLDGRSGRIDLLLVLGMHPDRPGFSTVPVTAWLPAPDPGHWADLVVRAGGPDFGNVLPGGELRGLFSVTSLEEVLKLASRLFHRLSKGTVISTSARTDEPRSALDLPPSSIPALHVTLDSDS